jgi:hypothetical protein
MKLILSLAVMMSFGCTLRPPAELYHPDSERALVSAWSEGFNGKKPRVLRALMHPLKRGEFDVAKVRVKHRLKTWRLQSYLFGEKVRVNNGFLGQRVQFNYHDGRQIIIREQLVVSSEGRWWMWSL